MKKEKKYYGLQACIALWKKRADDVVRVYLDSSKVAALKPILKWCSEHKKVYRIVTEEELQKVSESIHHEGVCFVAKEPEPLTPEKFLSQLKSEALLYLDGVENPHNLGSIARSCAHFNFFKILGETGKLPPLSPSACRVAKGGAEYVDIVHLSNPKKMLTELKKRGYAFIGTSSHQGESLFTFPFPKKAVLIMGSESLGVSPALSAFTTHYVQIPGSGVVESLNVSVATALCLGEYFRQHGTK